MSILSKLFVTRHPSKGSDLLKRHMSGCMAMTNWSPRMPDNNFQSDDDDNAGNPTSTDKHQQCQLQITASSLIGRGPRDPL